MVYLNKSRAFKCFLETTVTVGNVTGVSQIMEYVFRVPSVKRNWKSLVYRDETKNVDWIYLGVDSDKWWTLAGKVTNLRARKKGRKLFCRCLSSGCNAVWPTLKMKAARLPKYWCPSTSPHSLTTRKTNIDIFTAVRTSDITRMNSWLAERMLPSRVWLCLVL
jgi:hypothetical protein